MRTEIESQCQQDILNVMKNHFRSFLLSLVILLAVNGQSVLAQRCKQSGAGSVSVLFDPATDRDKAIRYFQSIGVALPNYLDFGCSGAILVPREGGDAMRFHQSLTQNPDVYSVGCEPVASGSIINSQLSVPAESCLLVQFKTSMNAVTIRKWLAHNFPELKDVSLDNYQRQFLSGTVGLENPWYKALTLRLESANVDQLASLIRNFAWTRAVTVNHFDQTAQDDGEISAGTLDLLAHRVPRCWFPSKWYCERLVVRAMLSPNGKLERMRSVISKPTPWVAMQSALKAVADGLSEMDGRLRSIKEGPVELEVQFPTETFTSRRSSEQYNR